MSVPSRPDKGPYADPTGTVVAVVMEKYAAPDRVLDAPIEHLTRRPEVYNGYADPDRCYPVHTPAAAWVSAGCYLSDGGSDTKVAAAIQSALAEHRLGREWDRMVKIESDARATKEAAERPTRFALPEHRRYPIDTPARIKAATDYFAEHWAAFDPVDRRTYATNLVAAINDGSKAASVAPDVVWRLEAEAGDGMLSRTWRDALEVRVKLARATGDSALVAALEKAGSSRPPDPAALADLLRGVDRVRGWDLPDPLSVLVSDTPSTAAAKVAGVVRAASGRWYTKEALMRVPDRAVADIMVGCGLPAVNLDAESHERFGGPIGLPIQSLDKRSSLLIDPNSCARFEALLADFGVAPVSQDPAHTDWGAVASGTATTP